MKKLLFTLCLSFLTASAAMADEWHVQGRISLPGTAGWDYLSFDPGSHRLFVTRGTEVMVVDVVSGELVGKVEGTQGVHGVALDPDLGRGFTSNGASNTVTIFDLASLKTMQQVAVGQKPDAIVYDAASSRVFAMDGKSDDITAIDAATGAVAGTVSLGGAPEYAAVDGHGHLFVNLEDKSEVAEVDTHALTLLGHWSLAPGDRPSGVAIDPAHHHLFIGCHNKTMVIFDTQAHTVAATVPIGEHVDANAFDPGLGEAFSSNGDGTLTVVDARRHRVVQTVTTESGARTMALDPVAHKIYLCTATPAAAPPAPGGHGPRTYQDGTFVVLVISR